MANPKVVLAAFLFAALGVAITQLFELTFVESDVVRAALNGLFVGAVTYAGIKSVEQASAE